MVNFDIVTCSLIPCYFYMTFYVYNYWCKGVILYWLVFSLKQVATGHGANKCSKKAALVLLRGLGLFVLDIPRRSDKRAHPKQNLQDSFPNT